MPVTIETINFVKRGGIYFTDTVTFTAGEGTLTCENLVFTSDADLIDTRINQVRAQATKEVKVLIRGKL